MPRKEREAGNSRANGQKGRMEIGERGKEGGTEGGKGKEMEREERREGKREGGRKTREDTYQSSRFVPLTCRQICRRRRAARCWAGSRPCRRGSTWAAGRDGGRKGRIGQSDIRGGVTEINGVEN